MIQMETILNVADNSGRKARKVRQGPGGSSVVTPAFADVIIGAVQEATQVVRVKKATLFAKIMFVPWHTCRKDGSQIRFDPRTYAFLLTKRVT